MDPSDQKECGDRGGMPEQGGSQGAAQVRRAREVRRCRLCLSLLYSRVSCRDIYASSELSGRLIKLAADGDADTPLGSHTDTLFESARCSEAQTEHSYSDAFEIGIVQGLSPLRLQKPELCFEEPEENSFGKALIAKIDFQNI